MRKLYVIMKIKSYLLISVLLMLSACGGKKEQGVQAGDTVGVLSHNIPQFPLTLFAIWYIGARALMLDTNLTPFEYDKMAQIAGCKFVCAESSFFYKTDQFKFIDITARDGNANPMLRPYEFKDTDIATLSFTSGSTGNPKVVPLTHYNLTECANSLEDMAEYFGSGDVMYGFLPLYHIFGFSIGILATVHFGAGIVLQPTVNPKYILDDFKKFRPHVIPAVPRLWELFRNKIMDTLKTQKKWRIVEFILRNRERISDMGLGFFVRKVQEPILDIFGGRVRLLIAGGAATKPEVETFYESLGLAFIQGYEQLDRFVYQNQTKNVWRFLWVDQQQITSAKFVIKMKMALVFYGCVVTKYLVDI